MKKSILNSNSLVVLAVFLLVVWLVNRKKKRKEDKLFAMSRFVLRKFNS